jgi:3',5'-cyclic AMP phosphodiesterase CpdA
MLDTVDTSKDSLMGHSGYLCSDRLSWLESQIESVNGKRVLVFMHHHPHKIGFSGMDMINMRNGAELLDLLTAHSNVAHFFAGHVHRTISGSTRGMSFSMFKSTCHQAPFVQHVQDPTLSVAEPAAYGIILLDENSVIAHSEDYEIAQMSTETASDAMPE